MAATGKAFVILLHTGHGPDHYDLMLERPDPLETAPAGAAGAAGAAGDRHGLDDSAEPVPAAAEAVPAATKGDWLAPLGRACPQADAAGDRHGLDDSAEPVPLRRQGKALATWQIDSNPAAMAEGSELPATRLPDHRRAYLSYEGPVSGGRGQVRRIDAGTYELLSRSPTRWEARLAGLACRGRFILYRPAGEPPDASWRIARASSP